MRELIIAQWPILNGLGLGFEHAMAFANPVPKQHPIAYPFVGAQGIVTAIVADTAPFQRGVPDGATT